MADSVADPTTLKAAIIQAMEEINDAAYDLRQEGLQVLLPEEVKFRVNLATELNAVNRVATDATDDDGQTVETTTREPSVRVSDKSGDKRESTRETIADGQSNTTITHPSVRVNQGGNDGSETITDRTYEDFEE